MTSERDLFTLDSGQSWFIWAILSRMMIRSKPIRWWFLLDNFWKLRFEFEGLLKWWSVATNRGDYGLRLWIEGIEAINFVNSTVVFTCMLTRLSQISISSTPTIIRIPTSLKSLLQKFPSSLNLPSSSCLKLVVSNSSDWNFTFFHFILGK